MLQTVTSNTLDESSTSRIEQIAQFTKKLVSNALGADDEKDLEEEYDASDAIEEEQAELEKAEEEQLVKELPSEVTAVGPVDDDDDDDDVDSKADEEEEVESVSVSSVDPLDEEALIASKSFGIELQSAMDHVSSIALDHREEMMSSIAAQYEEETGQRATEEMMCLAIRPFQRSMEVEAMEIASGSTSDGISSCFGEEEVEELDGSLLAEEMASALLAVRELGEEHRGEFVDRICDIYSSLNDEEPTTEELYDLLSGIRAQFVEEAESMDSLCFAADGDDEVICEVILAEEMEMALVQVRKQAQLDQEILVDLVCDYYRGLNGCDPSIEAISGIFGRIKEQFAEEEREEFLALNEDGDDEQDEDYEVDEDSDADQYALDEAEDIYIAEEHRHHIDDDDDDSTDSELGEQFNIDSISSMGSDGEYILEEDSASEYWADIVDEEELDLESESESVSLSRGQMESDEEEDEEELVQSALFAAEWCSAMDHIRKLAKYDQERIVCSVLDQMERDTEEPAALEMVEEAMDSLRATVLEFDDVDSEDAEEELAVEMEEALQNVRELGAVHREQIAMRICDLYREENGEEISAQKLSAIFSDVRDCFAEEALSTDSELEEEPGTEHPATFAVQWASAMDHVRAIAKCHQEQLVERFGAIYKEVNEREPTVAVLTEILDVVRESFADEAMDELLDDDLEIADSDGDDESEDSDYCPESDDDDQYAFDALDDVIYRDSSHSDGSESGTGTGTEENEDSAFDADQDANDLKELYAEDAEDDLADSDTDSVQEQEQELEQEELKQSEVASDSDSEYNVDGDAADYFRDYELEYAPTTSAASDSTDSEQSTDSEADYDYNPDYDLFDYSLDFELYREGDGDDSTDFDSERDSEFESEEGEDDIEYDDESDVNQSESDDDDYAVEKDTFDNSQDAQDDIEESSVDEEAEENQVAV